MTERILIPEPTGPYGVFTPPPPGGEPHLYALLAVEVKPGYIVYYHLLLDYEPGSCTIEIERDDEAVHTAEFLEPLRVYPRGPMRIRAALSGTVVSDRPDYRPPSRAQAPQPQLPEATPQIEGGPR